MLGIGRRYEFLIETFDANETVEMLSGLDLTLRPTGSNFGGANEYRIFGLRDDVVEAARRLDVDEESIYIHGSTQ